MNTDNSSIFRHAGPFLLESGHLLQDLHLAYHTYGRLNVQKDNAVWVFHALTANSDPMAWWPGLVGSGKLLDPKDYFIVCVNMPGSCYGSSGPLDNRPDIDLPYYHDFPSFTIHDMISAYQLLRDALGIEKIYMGIGGSMGGQQLLEWAVTEPAAFDHIVPIATNAWHSAWGKAFNESQRWCIEADPTWRHSTAEAGMEGMKVARSVALLSYRNYQTYDLYQSDEDSLSLTGFKAASYQHYQGEKLARRFNAFSYHQLSRSMDSHHVGRHASTAGHVPIAGHAPTAGHVPNAGHAPTVFPASAAFPALAAAAAAALSRITAKALVIGLHSDILFPLVEQQYLARHIPGAKFASIDSTYGHDGFLLESEAIEKSVRQLLLNQAAVTI
ncbi:MAG TPA: alpha/beta fold hydrolase [Puia sp.]|nr:alpha/beta fold hydrolase [Puia sp.]